MVIATESPNALYNSGLGFIGNFCPDIFIHFIHTIYLHIHIIDIRAILGLTKIKGRICPPISSPVVQKLPPSLASNGIATPVRRRGDATIL